LCAVFAFRDTKLFLYHKYNGPGVPLDYMFTATFPFKGKTFLQLHQQVLHLRYDIPSYLSVELQDIIIQLLTLRPSEKTALENIVGSLCFSQGEERSLSPTDTLPKHLNLSILAAMCKLGYKSREIDEFLLIRKFSE
jgi:hypothetical protein